MSGLDWIDSVGDVPAAKARAKHINTLTHTKPRDGERFVPESWGRLSMKDLTAHALARLGYSHIGVASAMGVGQPTARRYIRRVGTHMGRVGLEAAPIEALETWPRGPVCVLGTRSDVVASFASQPTPPVGYTVKQTDEGTRYVCKHGNVSTVTQRNSERVGAATSGVYVDTSGDSDRCRCISPLVRYGVW